MEYHSDRFQDYSLMVYKNGKLAALFPANRVENTVYSHQGLTYGGLLLLPKISASKVFLIFEAICNFLKDKECSKIYIKKIPDFYCLEPTFETAYLLGVNGTLVSRDMVLAIDYSKPLNIHKTKRKHYNKLKSINFELREDDALSDFWIQVLEPRLNEKHKAKPVHSLPEIKRLKDRFPNQIIQYNILFEEKLLAGITIFDKGHVVKSQYGATTPEGERLRALDYLFLFLIEKYKDAGKKFFSMGTVTDHAKGGYNRGLLTQKQELGCSLYLLDYLSVDLV